MVIYFGSDSISEKVNNTQENSGYSQKPSAAVMKQKFIMPKDQQKPIPK